MVVEKSSHWAAAVLSTTVTRQKMSLWASLSGVQIQWASSAMSGIGEPLTRRQIGTFGSPSCWAFWPKVVAWGQAESSKFAPSQPDGGAAPCAGAFQHFQDGSVETTVPLSRVMVPIRAPTPGRPTSASRPLMATT